MGSNQVKFRQKNNAAGNSPAAAIIPLHDGFNNGVNENHEDIRNKRAANSHSDIISEISYVYHLFRVGFSNDGKHHYLKGYPTTANSEPDTN